MSGTYVKKFIIGGILLPLSAGVYLVSNDKINSLTSYLDTQNPTSYHHSLINFSNHTSLTPPGANMQAVFSQILKNTAAKNQQSRHYSNRSYGSYKYETKYLENEKYFDPR